MQPACGVLASVVELDTAESVFLAVGILAAFCLLVAIVRGPGIRGTFKVKRPLPPIRQAAVGSAGASGFQLADLVVPPIWFLASQIVIIMAFRSLGLVPPQAASAPASAPASVVPPVYSLLANALVQVVTIGSTLVVLWRVTGGRLKRVGLSLRHLGKNLSRGLLGFLATWPIVLGVVVVTAVVLSHLRPDFQPQDHTAIRLLHDAGTPTWAMGLTIISAAIFAPLLEELFFRGMVQNYVARQTRSHAVGIVTAAMLFGCIHAELQNIPGLMMFGIALGFLYARSRSLTAAIAMHAFFNIKTLLFLFIFER